MAVVNSEKWNTCPDDVFNVSTRCMTGDAFPGGDTCDADGCTKKGPEKDMPPEFSGVEKVNIPALVIRFLLFVYHPAQ